MARARLRGRRRGPRGPKALGLKHAQVQQNMSDNIAAASVPGGRARRRQRRLDIGRPRGRLYPQTGLAAKQRFGLVPIPTVAGGLLDDDEE